MICVIRHLAVTVSDICLKLGCCHSTSTVYIQHIRGIALYHHYHRDTKLSAGAFRHCDRSPERSVLR